MFSINIYEDSNIELYNDTFALKQQILECKKESTWALWKALYIYQCSA